MVGGPFTSHVLNGRRFVCDADDTAQLTTQGKTNEVKPNGDGSNRVIQSRIPGKLVGTNLCFNPENGDDDFLNELRDSGAFFDYSGTANDGSVWSGSVQITSELVFDFKEGTVPVDFAGTFQKQG